MQRAQRRDLPERGLNARDELRQNGDQDMGPDKPFFILV
jgi:hypothetical protein